MRPARSQQTPRGVGRWRAIPWPAVAKGPTSYPAVPKRPISRLCPERTGAPGIRGWPDSGSDGRATVAVLAVVLLLGLSLAVALGLYRKALSEPVGRPAAARGAASTNGGPASSRPLESAFRVRPGENFATIARHLHAQGWITSPALVRLEARWRGFDRSVVPGYYRYIPGERVGDLLKRLARGEIEQVRVTIPEGWRLEAIVRTLADSMWVAPESLTAALEDSAWLRQLQVPGPGPEGYLFPDTYWMARGESPRRILARLIEEGTRFWRDSLEAHAASMGLDRGEVWTLASIIESEAARAEERTRIAAVFWNRLRQGMRLQSDPTVLYALGRPPGRVLYRDLEVSSPYNTYRVAGLPPGPICSPGRASLLAALFPLKGCADLFFVARGDGAHVFSRTLAEHNRHREGIRAVSRRPGPERR